MPFSMGDIGACLFGFVLPYCLFLVWRPPFNLRLDSSTAGAVEKLSYAWLRPLLILSGMLCAGVAYANRHSDDGRIIDLLLAAVIGVMLLTVPAGCLAFKQAYGWDRRRDGRKR